MIHDFQECLSGVRSTIKKGPLANVPLSFVTQGYVRTNILVLSPHLDRHLEMLDLREPG